MKKFKRIIAALTSLVSVVSLYSVFSVSASASTRYDTYAYVFYSPVDTYIKLLHGSSDFYSNSDCIYLWSKNGSLGGQFSVETMHLGSEQKSNFYYENSSPNSKAGIMGSAVYKVPQGKSSFNVDIISLINDRNNSLDVKSVSVNKLLMGDVNLDGRVNNDDVTLLNKYISGTVIFNETQIIAADVTNNGEIDFNDYSCIIRYVTGNSNIVVEE